MDVHLKSTPPPPHPLWKDLRALYHLPGLLRKNNAPSVILIMTMVSEAKGISCWRDQHIYRPRGGSGGWVKIYKMFHWLPLTSLQYSKYRVMGLRSSVILEPLKEVPTGKTVGRAPEKTPPSPLRECSHHSQKLEFYIFLLMRRWLMESHARRPTSARMSVVTINKCL